MNDSSKAPMKKVTWVKDASIQYEGRPGAFAMTNTHEFDDTLHVFVEYENGKTREWSADWGQVMPEWAKDAIDKAMKDERGQMLYRQDARP